MMLEYVRSELIKRLSYRLAAMRYSQSVDKKYSRLQERRAVERLLNTRKAA